MSRSKRFALRVSGFVLDYLLALPVGCAAALLWANTLPDSYYQFAQATSFLKVGRFRRLMMPRALLWP